MKSFDVFETGAGAKEDSKAAAAEPRLLGRIELAEGVDAALIQSQLRSGNFKFAEPKSDTSKATAKAAGK